MNFGRFSMLTIQNKKPKFCNYILKQQTWRPVVPLLWSVIAIMVVVRHQPSSQYFRPTYQPANWKQFTFYAVSAFPENLCFSITIDLWIVYFRTSHKQAIELFFAWSAEPCCLCGTENFCSAPQAIPNMESVLVYKRNLNGSLGLVTGPPYLYDDIAHYECLPGYKKFSTSNVHYCHGRRDWTGKTTCTSNKGCKVSSINLAAFNIAFDCLLLLLYVCVATTAVCWIFEEQRNQRVVLETIIIPKNVAPENCEWFVSLFN